MSAVPDDLLMLLAALLFLAACVQGLRGRNVSSWALVAACAWTICQTPLPYDFLGV